MRILCIGDVFAKTGRRAIQTELPRIKKEYNIDFVIANAENVTHCKGLSKKHYNELVSYGVDFFTMGNHTWNKDEVFELLTTKFNIVRPYNIKPESNFSRYGSGSRMIKIKNLNIRITNLLGSTVHFNNMQYSAFDALEEIIKNSDPYDLHIVDFHAETTSEKNSLFCSFWNKVSLIYGTHTHVQTADNRIRFNTAYITDIGMTGPSDGVIGAKKDIIINKFKTNGTKFHLEEESGKYQFCAIIVDFDEQLKIPTNIERIYIYEE